MRRSRIFATLTDTFWVLVLALVVMFLFFVALGAFAPGDVLGLTVAVCILAALWVGHAVWDARHRDQRDRTVRRARERRGF